MTLRSPETILRAAVVLVVAAGLSSRPIAHWRERTVTPEAAVSPTPSALPVPTPVAVVPALPALVLNTPIDGDLSGSSRQLPDGRPYNEYIVGCQKGQTLQLDVTSAVHDPLVIVRDAAGNDLGSDDDSGGLANARLNLKCAADGDLHALATISAEGGAAGAYRIGASAY